MSCNSYIQTYKILHGIYDTAASPVLTICHDAITRGNNWKLVKNFSRYDMHKYMFYPKDHKYLE